MFHDEVIFAFPIDTTILYKGPQVGYKLWSGFWEEVFVFPQDLLFNCDKYEELRKTLFHKIKSLLCPNVNLIVSKMN